MPDVKTTVRSNYHKRAPKIDKDEITALRRAFKRIGPVLVSRVQSRAPRVSGELADNFRFRVKRRRGVTRLRVSSLRRGVYVELGTVNQSSQEFARETFNDTEDDALQIVVEEMRRVGNALTSGARSGLEKI